MTLRFDTVLPCLPVVFLLLGASLCAGEGPTEKPEKDAEVLRATAGPKERAEAVSNPPRPLAEVAQLGEKLVFVVKWEGAPVGTVTARVWPRLKKLNGRDAYLFEVHAESNDFLSLIYPVDTTIKSYADAHTGRSYQIRRNAREGGYRADDCLQFELDHVMEDGTHQAVSIFSKVKNGRLVTKRPRPIPGPVQDALSIAYYLRHFDLEKAEKSVEVLLGTRKRTSAVYLKRLRLEKLTVPGLGQFECVVVEPGAEELDEDDRLFQTKGKAEIWLEKHTRIPLKATVGVTFGSVSVMLIEQERTALEEYRAGKPGPDAATPAAD